jgi:hypothetical protein
MAVASSTITSFDPNRRHDVPATVRLPSAMSPRNPPFDKRERGVSANNVAASNEITAANARTRTFKVIPRK